MVLTQEQINTQLNVIKNGVYGKDVRAAIWTLLSYALAATEDLADDQQDSFNLSLLNLGYRLTSQTFREISDELKKLDNTFQGFEYSGYNN